MKHRTNYFMALALVLILGSCQPEAEVLMEEETLPQFTMQANPGNLTVAEVDPQTGEMQLLVDRLSKHFEDGGPIQLFGLRPLGAEYAFIRKGLDAAGNSRVEAFKTVSSAAKVDLEISKSVVWYVVCDLAECNWCMPDSQGTTCECNSSEDITMYDPLTGQEVVIGQEEGGECPVGTAGGGLYHTKVFQW